MSDLSKADLRCNKNEQSFVTDDLTNNFQSIMEIADEKYASVVLNFPIRGLTSLADNDHGTKIFTKLDADISFEKSTPDILITDNKHLEGIKFKSENCPDLLQSVQANLNFNNDSDVTNELKLEYINESVSEDNNNFNNITSISYINTSDIDHSADKEDFWVRSAPADIIGDFEQEVEREFGLFVSGYKCLIGGNIIPDNKKYQHGFASKKICDAALSDGLERITQDKLGNSLKRNIRNTDSKHKIECFKENTHKINSQTQFINISTDKGPQLTNKSRNLEYRKSRSFGEKDQTKLIQIRDRLPNLYSLSEKTSQGDDYMPYIKYRKNSYDERQLPPVGIDYKCHVTKTRTSRRSQYADKQINGLQPNSSRMSFDLERNRRQEEEEIQQYRQLISCNKEFIISRSKYSKMSIWAQYLKNSVNNINVDELIDSQRNKLLLRVCATDTNGSTKHFKAMKNHVKSTEDSVRNVSATLIKYCPLLVYLVDKILNLSKKVFSLSKNKVVFQPLN